MKFKLPLLFCFILLSGCSFPARPPLTFTPTITQTPAITATAAFTFISTETPTLTPLGFTPSPPPTPTPTTIPSTYCSDPQVVAVIDSLKSSILTNNGALLSSLVDPSRGMEVQFFRTGKVITYTALQAQYLFTTTYQANWGTHPASGETLRGAFHDVVVPELIKIFSQPYTLHCNELRHGGATYFPSWEFSGNFYTVYFAGTEPYGNLDWHSWVIGIDYVNAKPYIYALTQFFWEP